MSIDLIRLLKRCEQPDPSTLADVLSVRHLVQQEMGDHLTYLAGYTHYREATEKLADYAIHLKGTPPTLVDVSGGAVHAKVFLNDLTQEVPDLDLAWIAARHQCRVFANRIVPEPWQGRPQTSLQEAGLDEEVLHLTREEAAPGLKRKVFHLARLPKRNTVESLQRALQHITGIVVAVEPDAMHNLSFDRLYQTPSLHPALLQAKWYIVPNQWHRNAVLFAEYIGASYSILTNWGRGHYYVDDVIADLSEHISATD